SVRRQLIRVAGPNQVHQRGEMLLFGCAQLRGRCYGRGRLGERRTCIAARAALQRLQCLQVLRRETGRSTRSAVRLLQCERGFGSRSWWQLESDLYDDPVAAPQYRNEGRLLLAKAPLANCHLLLEQLQLALAALSGTERTGKVIELAGARTQVARTRDPTQDGLLLRRRESLEQGEWVTRTGTRAERAGLGLCRGGERA